MDPLPSADTGPVALATHIRALHLRGLHSGAERGLDAAQAAIGARATLIIDDEDVAELAMRVAQALKVCDRIGARLAARAA